IVLCKPPFSISTPELFGCVDCRRIRCRPDTGGILSALEQGDLEGVARRMYNVFEDVLTGPRAQEIRDIKDELLSCGALGASMSGTGPTVFGLFAEEEPARRAVERLRGRYEELFLTQPVSSAQIWESNA
ncbi:MAG: 4-(cytidine 5'-diphospho)-2-C-methyl-D-erythritol kinase, partial [Oscillospiraceae bacterium]|nr:4-(cytidine 5'-diphospho)-2-C-methyl-D-erythritol kinase [Oscillospiraceae bacterium]